MNNTKFEELKIGVVGAGSWGTALSNLLAQKGAKIDLWVHEPEVIEQIRIHKENKIFLPGFALSDNIVPTNDIKKAVQDKGIVIVVVPSHFMRSIAMKIDKHISKGTKIISATKGIENKTFLTMSGVLKECISIMDEHLFCVLSGPSFAREVAAKLPTVVTVASKDSETARFIQHVFAVPYFRVYTSHDVIGVELGGSAKNVIAIASGIIDGLNLGYNTRAALITRGLTEIRRLGIKMGAIPRTFTGLAGMGDLLLTCTGDLSRNYTIGKKIGQGMKLKQILSEMRMVAEGVRTAKSVYYLSKQIGVEMPISHATYQILYKGLAPLDALYQLMTRGLRHELDDEY